MPMYGGLICIAFRLYVRHATKSTRKKGIAPRVIGFGHSMDVDDPKGDLKGQGHQVTKRDFNDCLQFLKVKGRIVQDQRSHGSMSN